MTTQPTQAQLEAWESFKGGCKRLDLEIRATGLRLTQLATIVRFKRLKGLPVEFDAPAMAAEYRRIWERNDRLKKCIMEVEVGRFGIRPLPNGDFQILAPAGSTADEIGPYALNGWFIFAVGVIVVYAAIEIWADLRQRNHDMYRKSTNLVNHADQQLCADPQSQTCRDWQQAKAENNFEEQHTTIGGLFDEAERWPDKIKRWLKTVGIGFAAAALVVAGVLLWQRKRDR